MPIRVNCPCGKVLNAPDRLAGKMAKCPGCQQAVNIPDILEEIDIPKETAIDRMLSGDTRASNPGNVQVDWVHCFLCWPVGTTLSFLAASALGAYGVYRITIGDAREGVGIIVSSASLMGFIGRSWYTWSRVMIYGCANPGMVVDAAKGLVAVLTDLDTGTGENFWVIKIVKQPLGRMADGPAENGQHVGTVAGYTGDGSKGQWETFEPCVVGCITRKNKTIKRVLKSFDSDDWELLTEALKEVPTPWKQGQWRVLER